MKGVLAGAELRYDVHVRFFLLGYCLLLQLSEIVVAFDLLVACHVPHVM